MIIRYFKQEDFNKCMEFLKDKPDIVETQKQLVAIWNGKYDENFKNYWRQ